MFARVARGSRCATASGIAEKMGREVFVEGKISRLSSMDKPVLQRRTGYSMATNGTGRWDVYWNGSRALK